MSKCPFYGSSLPRCRCTTMASRCATGRVDCKAEHIRPLSDAMMTSERQHAQLELGVDGSLAIGERVH